MEPMNVCVIFNYLVREGVGDRSISDWSAPGGRGDVIGDRDDTAA